MAASTAPVAVGRPSTKQLIDYRNRLTEAARHSAKLSARVDKLGEVRSLACAAKQRAMVVENLATLIPCPAYVCDRRRQRWPAR